MGDGVVRSTLSPLATLRYEGDTRQPRPPKGKAFRGEEDWPVWSGSCKQIGLLRLFRVLVFPVLERFPAAANVSRACFMKKSNSSMQLTRAADYGVRVMVHLASLPARQRTLLPTLAEATGAPESFLSKVLQALTRAKLIASRRGHAGGFEILPRGRQASMREVVEAIDGPIFLNVCLISDGSCGRETWCPAHPVWAEAQQAMLDVLSKALITEMARQEPARQVRASAAAPAFAALNVLPD